LDRQSALESQTTDTGEISQNAIRCLTHLFEDRGVFAPIANDEFDIDNSFDVDLPSSGFLDAREVDVTDYYLLLASVRFQWRRDTDDLANGRLETVEYARRSVEYVIALYNGLASWMGQTADNKRRLHDPSHKTEQFRRIPAFLELAEQLVMVPLKILGNSLPPTSEGTDEEAPDEEAVPDSTPPPADTSSGPRTTGQAQVTNHLKCFGRFYTEEYLQYLHEWTGVAAVVELMASLDPPYRLLIDFLNFERSFVDGTGWVIPFADIVDAQAAADAFLSDSVDLSTLKPISVAMEVRMPANGVYVEAFPGRCVLPSLPVDSTAWIPPAPVQLVSDPWIPGTDDEP
jgi:hypothetical protein